MKIAQTGFARSAENENFARKNRAERFIIKIGGKMKKIILCMFTALIGIGIVAAKEANYADEKSEVRIQNVLAKIRRGEPVVVAALGGSITTGYSANPIAKNSWAAKTAEWFDNLAKKNNSKIVFLNEGVSGTDSAFAAVRTKNHIIENKADLVILEFSVNDMWLSPSVRNRTYEGVIRQIMNNSETAILALFLNTNDAGLPGQQKEQQKITDYYHVPHVSWKDCVLQNASAEIFNDFYDAPETVHPNNKGHDSIANCVIQKLDDYWKNLPADKKIPKPVKKLPAPALDDSYEFAQYYHKDNLKPAENDGWKEGTPRHDDWIKRGNVREGWQSNKAGGEIVFEAEGSVIGVTYCESDDFRNATAWVVFPDGTESEKVPLQCYVSYRNGYYGWAYKELFNGEKSQKCQVHVMCSKRAAADRNGKFCNITGIVVGKKQKN